MAYEFQQQQNFHDKCKQCYLYKLWGTVIDKFIIRVEIQTYAFVRRDMNDYLADVIDDRIQATVSQITNVMVAA